MAVHGLGVLDPADWPTSVPLVRLWDIGVTWRDLNPAPGLFDFDRLDHILTTAQTHGTSALVYVLGSTPQWAASDPALPGYAPWIGPGSNSAPADLDTWDAYVTAMVRRYAHRIRAWQVWNEPQLRWFWAHPGYGRLAELTRRVHRIIKAHDPGLRVLGAPVLPRPSSGGMAKGRKYLEALAVKGWPIDVHTAHLYPEAGYGPPRWRQLAQSWRRGLVETRAPRLPHWVTETNFNLGHGPLPAGTCADWVAKTNTIADAEGIARVIWYAHGTHSNPRLLGIPFTPDSPGTGALTALRPKAGT